MPIRQNNNDINDRDGDVSSRGYSIRLNKACVSSCADQH
jgi:hypothetical protein